MNITKLRVVFALLLVAALPVWVNGAPRQTTDYVAADEIASDVSEARSATDVIAEQVTQTPGDIYRGSVFGVEKKTYPGEVLGNRPRATKKLVYDTSLILAVKKGDADRVRTLLFAHVDPDEKNYAGITPMTIAGEKGNMEVIRLLVERGKADLNAPSSYGVTPLIAAAAAGKAEAVAYLLKHGADASAKDDLGKTALLYASGQNQAKMVANLAEANQPVVNLPDNTGNTPLLYSAQKGFTNNVKALLANGAKPDYRNPASGLSAMATAAAEGHVTIIRLLAKNKADVNLPDLSGRTPIFYAVENNQLRALRTLLILGADPNVKDHNGVSVLMRAAAQNREDCLALLLRQKTIDVNAQDNLGRSVVAYSAYAEDIAPAEKLVAAQADINLTDYKGNTPLMDAIKAKNDRVAVYLIQQGADLSLQNKDGETVFSLTDQYLPDSSTSRVLAVKRDIVIRPAVGYTQRPETVQLLEGQEAQQAAQAASAENVPVQTDSVTETPIQPLEEKPVAKPLMAPSVIAEEDTAL